MTVFDIISLLGGLSMFLYGMHLMGEGLQKSSGGALKRSLEKIQNNQFLAFIVGVAVTCVIQSSTATIVLAVGMVGAGVLTFRQSISIVLGANVGTTVTAQMIRLLDINSDTNMLMAIFKPSTLAPVAMIIGIIFIMFIKKHSAEVTGAIAMGFGILFAGLLSMTAAVAPLSYSTEFYQLLTKFSASPLLGLISGTVITAIIQSSSAVMGMLQVLCSTDALTFSAVYPIIIGINIGTCVTTAAVCSIGAKAAAKRTGVIHIIFNVVGAILMMIFLAIAFRCGLLNNYWNMSMSSGDIANFHTIFNLFTALILLPFIRVLEKLSYKLVKDDVEIGENVTVELEQLNDKLFISPPMALQSAHNAISAMSRIAKNSVHIVFGLFLKFDAQEIKRINADEERIDRLADSVDNYLIRLSADVTAKSDSNLLNYYIQCFSEFERIGDFAVNLSENATELYEKNMKMSDTAQQELQILSDAINDILNIAHQSFTQMDFPTARRIEPLEEVIDDMVALLKSRHIERLRKHECNVYSGLIFLDVLTNAERIADHCSNIGVYTLAQDEHMNMESHHDYIRELHQGNDPFYTEEFNRNQQRYYQALQKI